MPSESTKDSIRQLPQFPWRVFWLLVVAAIAGAGAALPLALEIFRPIIQSAPGPSLPLPLIIPIAIAQNLVLMGLFVGFGLLLARKLGLGAPLLESWLYHKDSDVSASGSLGIGAIAGIAAGIVVLILMLIAAPHLPGLPFVSAARAAVWKRLLVGLYGGIVEEIFSRLFLLSLIAWLGTKLFQKTGELSARVFWASNFIVAILFGLGHLPSASLVMHITPAVVLLALVLNGIPAISFGYLYWKRGLESAMIAHFCADFVVWVIGPAFLTIR
jgi:membrane protease YdiL (CAAX protease family)